MDLKELGEEANVIEERIGLNIDDSLNKLTQELGEFNDAVQKSRGRYCKKKGDLENVKEEVGDLFFNIVSICNKIGINPNELSLFAENTLKKLKEREELYKKSIKGE